MRSNSFIAAATATLAALSFAASSGAEVKNPPRKEAPPPAAPPVGTSGQVHSPVEIEPHFATAVTNGIGFGLGARVAVSVVPEGLLAGIDDSLSIGFGADWIRYGDCGDFRGDTIDCEHVNALWVPGVAQWNFYLSPQASLFVEGGFAVAHASYGTPCTTRDALSGNQVDIPCTSTNDLHAVIGLGGRYKFADHAAATVRLGYPYFSIGASYL